MTDAAAIAHGYLEGWNETDPSVRQTVLRTVFADDARYSDPLTSAEGLTALDALIGGVQERFPGFRFALRGQPDGHGGNVRFSWSLGPDGAEAPIEGTDFVVVEEGRIRSVTGFLDKVPGPVAD